MYYLLLPDARERDAFIADAAPARRQRGLPLRAAAHLAGRPALRAGARLTLAVTDRPGRERLVRLPLWVGMTDERSRAGDQRCPRGTCRSSPIELTEAGGLYC